MPVASLPSPVQGLWHVGPVPVHGYALCVVLGIVALLWLTECRYRALGGRPWLITDMATVVVPAGLAGGRFYRVVVDYQWYFGHGRDWVDVLRLWDGGLAVPGAAAGGLAAAWLWCRRTGTGMGPVVAAAAPGLALGQAIGVLGNWFSQGLYGPPSAWPWAVAISPWHRVAGYQNYGTYQPLFLYESAWDALVAVALVYLIRALVLTGDRALALAAGLYAAGMLATVSLLLAGPRQMAGIRAEQATGAVVIVGAAAYLVMTRARRGPEALQAGPPRRLRRPSRRRPLGAPGGIRTHT